MNISVHKAVNNVINTTQSQPTQTDSIDRYITDICRYTYWNLSLIYHLKYLTITSEHPNLTDIILII